MHISYNPIRSSIGRAQEALPILTKLNAKMIGIALLALAIIATLYWAMSTNSKTLPQAKKLPSSDGVSAQPQSLDDFDTADNESMETGPKEHSSSGKPDASTKTDPKSAKSVASKTACDIERAQSTEHGKDQEEPLIEIAIQNPLQDVQRIEKIRQQVITPPPLREERFETFTIKILEGRFSPISSTISSKEEMRLKAQEVGQQVLDEHVKLRIDIPSYDLERTQAMKFIEELRTVVDVISTQWPKLFYIVPKKTEKIQDSLTIRTYKNGVIEEVQSSREREGGDWWTYWRGRRIYPNGVTETGRFDKFVWHSGTRVEKEVTTYRLPETLVTSYDLDRHLMYADIEGEIRLIVIHKKPGSSDFSYDYVQVNEELIPTLAKILQEQSITQDDFNKDTLNEVLSETIDCQEFVQFLFDTDAIFSLNSYAMGIILEIIQEKKLTVNLRHQHPGTGETLLDCYSKNSMILKTLLAFDSTLIHRTKGVETAFVRALLSGNKKGASILFNTMEDQKIPLLPRELLFKKVAFSEGEVTLEELQNLPLEDHEIVFRLANIYSQLNVVQTMRTLGFDRRDELIMREGPAFFGCNMDALEMHERLEGFLTYLRSQKLLLTQSEFDRLPEENYIDKGGDIGRILGRNYIEKKASELGLKHVKVPKKIMVIVDGNTSLKLHIDATLDIIAPSGGITVYAEMIRKANRSITSEEVSELLRLFEATGFSDIHWGNMIVAEDGIYIIDTEFTNFWLDRFYFEKGHQYAEMTKIVHALPVEQQQKLIDELHTKIKIYQENEGKLNEQQMLCLKVEQAALQKSGCFYGPSFTFSVSELIHSSNEM